MVVTIILGQIFVLAGLIFVLKYFMKGHVSGAVEHLQRLNEELVKQQTELKQKMADSEREYQSKMTSLTEDISSKQKQAREEAIKSLEDSKQRALQEREKIIGEAVQTREKMRQEIMAEMDEKAIMHSKNIIAELMTDELGKMFHAALMEEVIAALTEVNLQTFQISTDTVQLKTPLPIEAEDKKKIAKILKEKIQKDIQFKEEVDPSLVAGLILTFGTFVVDGSLMNRVAESAARIKQETKRRYQSTL